MDICENGIKHVTWEMTKKRTDPDFFAKHTVTELMSWSDFALEDQGRLTHPMAYNPATDKYEPVSWDTVFQAIAKHLRGMNSPNRASFYTSGILSNEGTFLYQLLPANLVRTICLTVRICVTKQAVAPSLRPSLPEREL